MIFFLLLGQSNMAGPGISRYSIEDDERLVGVKLLNDKDEWEDAKNPLNRYSTVKWNPNPGISPGVTFAEEIKKIYPNEEIGLVSNARGSSKIAEWQKGELYFNEAVRRAKIAMKNASLAGILWLQGCQDAPEKNDYSVYEQRFSKFIFDIREELGGQDIPFIAGEIWGDTELAPQEHQTGIFEVNEQINKVIRCTKNCALISTRGVEHVACDLVHFAPEGMRVLGRRYADKYKELFANKYIKS